ncbi:MerC domain-containing protein [Psychromonas sp. RZ22]|uniref:MerC domain-containing protein n=1 Tax=Psychromonas algarum TaxID=2555643 RepID=UPI0010684789|nr:MerC domain-containing protein [Psychromonas sp. RZ22]TEW54854.1 MerC domain-containing protein [Psychromonas sp. RZ22]
MKSIQAFTDKLSIGLSMLCAIHCLLLPFLLVLVPSTIAVQLGNEAFHAWMVFAVLPTSIYALTLGCKKHKNYRLIALGISGLLLLVLAVVLGEYLFGHLGEKIMTLAGATLLAIGHCWNFRLCREHEDKHKDDSCDCSEH